MGRIHASPRIEGTRKEGTSCVGIWGDTSLCSKWEARGRDSPTRKGRKLPPNRQRWVERRRNLHGHFIFLLPFIQLTSSRGLGLAPGPTACRFGILCCLPAARRGRTALLDGRKSGQGRRFFFSFILSVFGQEEKIEEVMRLLAPLDGGL